MGTRGPARWPATALSFAGHAAAVLALLAGRAEPPAPLPPQPTAITLPLVEPPPRPLPPTETPRQAEPEPAETAEAERVAEPPPRPEPPRPSPVKAPPRRLVARPTVSQPPADAIPVGGGATGQGMAEVGDGELAGATTAGSGGGGGACDMPRRLQDALRKDRRVQAAVREVDRGRALLVWNGDWVRHPAQEGAGLAAVREAIMWEVGFAPKECRAQPMRGLVLISLNDGAPPLRLALGSARWRWSDLLFAKSAPAGG